MEELSNSLALKESGLHSDSERMDFVKTVVERIICKSFSTEFEQDKKVSHTIRRERYIRGTLKLSNKDFR
ncbi:MAG: hypothetical protein KAW12_03475 [Candidatus Aminicenantes bacterium]|nr:hypothetical protein [Candidatus Aminicenantes bacterium]